MSALFQVRTERDLKRPGYCALSHMRTFIALVASGRLRKGDVITAKRLNAEFGVPRSEQYLVMAAARHLGFVDEYNRITDLFEQLVHATGDEYEAKFKAVLRDSYPDVFDSGLDLTHATPSELKKIFEACDYAPSDMQMKMVTLFREFCRMAGIVQGESKGSQAGNGHSANIPSTTPPLNAVPLTLTEFKPMPEHSLSSMTNGAIRARVNDSLVLKVLANFEKLRQQRLSTDWTEMSRAMWEDQLKLNETMLEQAWELMEGKKQ